MNTKNIIDCLKNVNDFIGVFPRDKLPKGNIHRPSTLIINQDSSFQPGSHWVAIKIKRNERSEYFDSYGLYPVNYEIVQFLDKYSRRNWIFNTKCLQGLYSDVCGQYVCTFADFKGKMEKYTNMFNSNSYQNDRFVCELFNKRFTCGKNNQYGQSCRRLIG